jgi:hypothetical protein
VDFAGDSREIGKRRGFRSKKQRYIEIMLLGGGYMVGFLLFLILLVLLGQKSFVFNVLGLIAAFYAVVMIIIALKCC